MATTVSTRLPFAVEAAVVEAAGKAFWYKRPLTALLERSGVPRPLLDRYASESKYVLMREVWSELHQRGSAGTRVQRQIVREFASLRTFGDDVDAEAAKRAVVAVRELAEEYGVLAVRPAALEREMRRRESARLRAEHDRRIQATVERRERREALFKRFANLATASEDRQERGLSLEPLLGDLIALEDVPYQPPYRKGTVTQTDGYFSFQGFSYLIEARWRKHPPDVAALNAFAAKVHAGLQSTRGLFVSVAGFREDAVDEFERGHRNVILLSGTELVAILEGRFTFVSAMQRKVDEAAKTGGLFFDLMV